MLLLRIVTLFALFSQQPQQAQKEVDYCAVPANTKPSLPAVLMEGMGVSNFPITTSSPEAQKFFNQGIAQMHSFWFRESERSFMQAAELDPNAAMAYWGIAVSAAGDYRPAFQLRRNRSAQGQPPAAEGTPMARAKEAIAKAMELRSKVSERERLYIEAVAARRSADSKDPDGDYVAGLRKVIAAFPADLEAKSMLALALENGYEPLTKEARPGTMESLALLKAILAKDPDHIGAHHYVIHGYEGGKEPEAAWSSCKRYPELVTNIPHALHMPGHIYAQSGRMEDAAHAFSSAALNELGYMSRDALYGSGHYAHNHHFLVHTLGMQGRFQEAITRTKEIMTIKENPRERASVDGSSAYRQGWFVLVKTLVRFEKWDEILDGNTLPRYDRPRENSWYFYARGLAQATKGNQTGASAELAAMEKSLEELKAVARTIPPQLDVALMELKGFLDVKAGRTARGLETMRKAAQMEAALLYTEPPAYPRPVLEPLGKALLTTRDFKAAESAYRELLAKEPGSGRALWGIASSLEGAGKRSEAEKVWKEFSTTWSTADSDLPEVRGARRGTSVQQ
ncbi:MAG: hypothetical protein HY646_18975 [Acidobacteria bacterium]|nr:hypothetical protein [Acidobacteriota bacterium]